MKLLSLILFLTPVISGAQILFSKGYLVTEKGDTLKGEVRVNPKKEHELYGKVFFKDASGLQKNYKPEKTKSYGFDNRRFVAVTADGEGKFFEVLASGPIGLYKTVVESTKMNETVYEALYYLSQELDKTPVAVKENKFRKQISEFMKDAPELLSSYPEEKTFNVEKATELIKNYNALKTGR